MLKLKQCAFQKPTQFPKDISIKLIKQIFLRKFFKVAQSDYNTNATDAVPTSIQHPATTKKSQSWNYGNLKPDDGHDDEKEEDDDERVFPKASFTCGEQQNLVAVFLFDLRANGCTCQLNSFLSSGKNVVVTSHSFAIKTQHLLASQILFSPS